MACIFGKEVDLQSSDESDEDYVPSGGEESEEVEGDVESEGTHSTEGTPLNRKKKLKEGKNVKSRKRKRGKNFLEDEDRLGEPGEEEDKNSERTDPKLEETKIDPEKEKKRVDDLWNDFLSDMTPPPKASRPTSSITTSVSKPSSAAPKPTAVIPKPKVTITKVFEFAGESVIVKEEVDSDSKAAQEFSEQPKLPLLNTSSSASKETKLPLGVKKSNGLNAVLGQVMNKKTKLSTLEKSKLDWNNFKKEEGVEEVLDQYKKGKDGYLDRQAFLERTDFRQFEIEKDLRATSRSHKL